MNPPITGIFDTIKILHGHPVYLGAHLARLAAGCAALNLGPAPAEEEVRRRIDRDSGVLRVAVTTEGTQWASSPPRYRDEDLAAGWTVSITDVRLPANPRAGYVKTLDRTVFERVRSAAGAADEGIALDGDGNLAEGSRANLFWVTAGRLFTPRGDCGILEGILRGRVIDLAKELGIDVEFVRRGPSILMNADEVFLTNSLIGVTPVREVDGRRLALGPVTAKLRLAQAADEVKDERGESVG